jgi:hypothetical protein
LNVAPLLWLASAADKGKKKLSNFLLGRPLHSVVVVAARLVSERA